MEINRLTENEVTVLAVAGRLDTNTAPQLEAAVQELNPEEPLVLDLADVEYVSSAGLRVFLMAQKMFGENLTFRRVKDSVQEVLDITGFSDILKIE